MDSKNKAAIFLIVVAVILVLGIVVMNMSLGDMKPVNKLYVYKSQQDSGGVPNSNVAIGVTQNPSGAITP